MRFEVPQFIDVEDKMFGPLTFKQFVYLVGGGALAYVSYKIIPSPFCYLAMAIFVGFACALAFYKLNRQTFLEVIQAWLKYQFKGKVYIWHRAPKPKESAPLIAPTPKKAVVVRTFDEKTLTDLSQNLDILDHS